MNLTEIIKILKNKNFTFLYSDDESFINILVPDESSSKEIFGDKIIIYKKDNEFFISSLGKKLKNVNFKSYEELIEILQNIICIIQVQPNLLDEVEQQPYNKFAEELWKDKNFRAAWKEFVENDKKLY